MLEFESHPGHHLNRRPPLPDNLPAVEAFVPTAALADLGFTRSESWTQSFARGQPPPSWRVTRAEQRTHPYLAGSKLDRARTGVGRVGNPSGVAPISEGIPLRRMISTAHVHTFRRCIDVADDVRGRDWHENEQGQYHYRQDYYEPTHLSLLCSSYPYRRTRVLLG
jgi:hypothetical protein